LGQDKLIHQDAIAGLKMIWAVDEAGCFTFDLQRPAMRRAKLSAPCLVARIATTTDKSA
jgi:hypothetical protein